MEEFWNKVCEKPVVACVLFICLTILGCAMIFGMVSCTRIDNEYRLKMYK